MRLKPRLIVLLAVSIFSGCDLDSLNPITAVETAEHDQALFGVWHYKDDRDEMYIHIGPLGVEHGGSESTYGQRSADPHRFKLLMIDHDARGITEETYIAHVSRVGGQRYLNIHRPQKKDKPGGFVFARYALPDKNTLSVSLVDAKALHAAIREGKIKGKGGDDSWITAPSAEVAAFLIRNEIFSKPQEYRRTGELPDREAP